MAHPTDLAATLIVIAVGVITLFLAALALRAQRRSGNRRLGFVAAAFGTFALKSFLTAWALQTGNIAHEHLEVVAAGFDLVVVVLLVIPLLR